MAAFGEYSKIDKSCQIKTDLFRNSSYFRNKHWKNDGLFPNQAVFRNKYNLHRYRALDGRPGVVVDQSEVFILEVEDALYVRVQQHLRQGPGLTG